MLGQRKTSGKKPSFVPEEPQKEESLKLAEGRE
jgi:hypothetical protein